MANAQSSQRSSQRSSMGVHIIGGASVDLALLPPQYPELFKLHARPISDQTESGDELEHEERML
jgi:hypothetical protein